MSQTLTVCAFANVAVAASINKKKATTRIDLLFALIVLLPDDKLGPMLELVAWNRRAWLQSVVKATRTEPASQAGSRGLRVADFTKTAEPPAATDSHVRSAQYGECHSVNLRGDLSVVTSSSRLAYLNRSDAEHDKRYKQL